MMNLIYELKENPGILPKIVVLIYRFGNITFYKIKVPLIKQLLYVIYRIIDFLILKLFLNDDIPAGFQAGWGLKIYHPYGIIINSAARVGENFVCRAQVTIGNRGEESDNGCPVIGDNVSLGIGAKIFGPIEIGDNCFIGASAIVTKNLEANKKVILPSSIIKELTNEKK
ncbi:serine acetyltransferase [Limosilactobacillus reuteri]|uniref:serine acetyltransferase n=1 Tax=Limosilactobacillus reuteri TaxID=1598 RepID=UPI001159A1A0|nr:serine acetyltransferase [Limosilactobacillus reuteri]QDK48438.1 hypothetical protein DPH67_04740 [Limosilactobacillus reuteri]